MYNLLQVRKSRFWGYNKLEVDNKILTKNKQSDIINVAGSGIYSVIGITKLFVFQMWNFSAFGQ
jgi:hypothetical protein